MIINPMFLSILLLTLLLLALAAFLLCFNIIFRKNGKFPETHIGKNKEMTKRGINCTAQDTVTHAKKHVKNQNTSLLVFKN
jgi:hypothetical protein